jgi:hypothetical protein
MTITRLADKAGAALTPTEADQNVGTLDLRTGPGWRDNIAQIDTRGGGTAPGLNLYRDGIYLYEFSAESMMEVFANYHIDHDYKLGSMLYPHLHFTTTNASAGVVRLGFEYTIAKGHQQAKFPASSTLYLNVTVPANSDHLHFVAELGTGNGIAGTGIEPDTVVLMRVFRDAASPADTFAGTIFGICADLHYECDRYATPNRAPDFYA